MLEKIKKAIEIITSGGMVIVVDDENRENEGDIIFSARYADAEKINFCMKNGSGVVCVAMDEFNINRLGLKPIQKENTDPFYTAFYTSIDADPKYGISTGISANDRAITIRMLADVQYKSSDFRKPGHIFPLLAKNYGVIERGGHTEAAIDLMKLAKLEPMGVICELVDEDGAMLRGSALVKFAKDKNLQIVTVEEIKKYMVLQGGFIDIVSKSYLPTEFGLFNISIYHNKIKNIEQVVLSIPEEIRDIKAKPIIRMHSECITSEIFFSQKCDCKQELVGAMQALQERKNGIIIYFRNHEGRGIGIGNKIKAYSLQDKGENTIDANLKLGLEVDSREYIDAIAIIKKFKFDSFDLYTGNPEKLKILLDYGFNVSQVFPKVIANKHNDKYLDDKVKKMGHKIIIN